MERQIHYTNLFYSDLYQFTSTYAYYLSGKHQQIATFQIFFRKHPFQGQYVICAGITAVKQFIQKLEFTDEQIKFLVDRFPHMKHEYFAWLKKNIQSQIKIKSLQQGEIVFSKEPIISYTGPLGIVQLLETPVLNLLGFASLVATNASRMVKAVYPKPCVEFGLRRAQGPDGALSASHYSYLGGFAGTSNLQAALLLNIGCEGTMSHAYVTSFFSLDQVKSFIINDIDIVQTALKYRQQFGFNTHDGELAAFLMYARAFQNHLVALIDTYSTLDSGLLNAIVVGKALGATGIKKIGIRLDSGDLCQNSKKCRKIWQKYVSQVKLTIIASDDLNEERLIDMEKRKSQIDVYAIGTNIATCQKQPALGLVCKLVELNGTPLMKFSQTIQKATYPAKKSLYRIWIQQNKKAKFDLITLQKEQIGNKMIVIDVGNHLKRYEVNIAKAVPLYHQWIKGQQKLSVGKSRQTMLKSRNQLPGQIFELAQPQKYPIMMSQQYLQVLDSTLKKNIVLRKFE